MKEFKREERYIVVKLSDLHGNRYTHQTLLHRVRDGSIPTRECVVVEAHWPIYEQTWDAVQRLAEGRPQRIAELEAELDQLREQNEALTLEHAAMDQERGKQRVACLRAEKERDALAAHVERIRETCLDSGKHVGRRQVFELQEFVYDAPQTSLAQRDARMKAEALEGVVERPIWTTVYAAKSSIKEIAGLYRQQAEENNQ